MGGTMGDYINTLQNFLPLGATILELQQPQKRAAILLADIDGDQMDELIGAYRYEQQNYIILLKKHDNQWLPLKHIDGKGNGISDLRVAPVTENWVNTLIVGWRIDNMRSQLDLLQWTNGGIIRLPTNNVIYSKLEVEDMPDYYGKDGQYELAIWVHDTGDAYKVDVYRFSEGELVRAKDVYPYYFKKVAAYYEKLLQTNDFSYYWYYLSDAQRKAGNLEQNLTSIDKALSFRSPYPSKEQLLDKKQQVLSRLTHARTNGQTVIDKKRGDITGDSFRETVYLTGSMTEKSSYWEDITLNILNKKVDLYEGFSLKETVGYNPRLFLGDFTGNQLDDILVLIDTGESEGTIKAYLFSFLEGEMRQVFDSEEYNDTTDYKINYQDQYKVTIVSSHPKKKYTLDLMYKEKEYLMEIYDENGALKEPIEGWVEPISGLYPIDFAGDDVYGLVVLQEIAGRYQSEVLGYVQNILRWNGREFITERQSVIIFGENIEP